MHNTHNIRKKSHRICKIRTPYIPYSHRTELFAPRIRARKIREDSHSTCSIRKLALNVFAFR